MPSRGKPALLTGHLGPLYHNLILSYISSLPPAFSPVVILLLNSLRSFYQTFLGFHSFPIRTFPSLMELHRRSCVLPSNAPVLPESDQVIPSRVLQERSGNRQHGYPDGSASWKRSPSSPVENLHSQNLSGSYLTGNLGTQLHGEKSEEQIHHETKRLLALLQRCEKYQKYRDRQPQNAKEREQKWPEFLEEAFFRGTLASHSSLLAISLAYLFRIGALATYGPSKAYARWPASRTKRVSCRLHSERDRYSTNEEAGVESYSSSQKYIVRSATM